MLVGNYVSWQLDNEHSAGVEMGLPWDIQYVYWS